MTYQCLFKPGMSSATDREPLTGFSGIRETKQDSGIHRHAADTRIGLICNTVPEEAVGR